MPYPNEHAARVINPDFFEPKSFRSKDLKDGVRLVLGKLKAGNGSMVVQAYRFSVDNFTVEQAKKWLEDHKVKFIKFEPAQNVSKNNILEHIGTLGMKWGHRKAQAKIGSGSNVKNVAKVEKSWNKVKNEPLSKHGKDILRTKRIVAAVLVAAIFTPDLIRGGASIGQRKISNYKFDKYGGFDPKNVVNAKFWDAPVRSVPIKLLTGGM